MEQAPQQLAEPELVLRAAAAADVLPCADIVDAWVWETPWMPRVNDHAALVARFEEQVLPACEVRVAEAAGRVLGLVAWDGEGYVAGLYVAAGARGRGIGAALLAAAQAARPEGLTLWTFVANTGARAFYARHGFLELGGSDGENDEGLPDVQLGWRAP